MESHRVDKSRVSMLTGDNRTPEEMMSILGMDLPVIAVKETKPTGKKPEGHSSRYTRVYSKMQPAREDKEFTIELKDKNAAREFVNAFNHSLMQFSLKNERDFEVGEMTFYFRGVRFASIYIGYCEKWNVPMKRCQWNGDGTVTFYLPWPSPSREKTEPCSKQSPQPAFEVSPQPSQS